MSDFPACWTSPLNMLMISPICVPGWRWSLLIRLAAASSSPTAIQLWRSLSSGRRKIQFCPLLYDGWWKSNHTQRWWHSLRNLQSHIEEDPCHQIVKTYWSFGKLRPTPQRVFLRPASRCLLTGSQLLSNRKVALSNPCLWSTLWRRARILGARFQSSRTLLLDDLYNPQRHSGNIT